MFLSDTRLVSGYYVYVLFKNMYFLMLIFIFGEKILKDSDNRCFKAIFRILYGLSLSFYSLMFLLNLVDVSKTDYFLPCKCK